MAGIGFELRALDRSTSLSVRAAGMLHAVWIVAGPVVMATVTLPIVRLITHASITTTEFQVCRVIVIYAFMASLIATAGIALVGARQAADAIYSRKTTLVRAHVLGALLAGSILSSIAGGAVFILAATLPSRLAMLATSLTIATGWLWTIAAFVGALRDFRSIATAFLIGIATIVLLASVLSGSGLEALVMAITAGVITATMLLLVRFLAFFSGGDVAPAMALIIMMRGLRRFPTLAAGGTLAATGVWLDKWILWGSSLGAETAAGLRHAPLYDQGMFAAYLAMLPLLAHFAIYREAGLYVLLRRYLGVVQEHGTLRAIESAGQALVVSYRAAMLRLVSLQLMIALLAILLLPAAVELIPISYRQIPIARFALLGSVFHLCLLASSSVLLLTDSRMENLFLQVMFLILNGLSTQVFLLGGLAYAGLGYLFSCLVCGSLAFWRADRVLSDLPYLTFQRSLTAARSGSIS